MCDETLALFIRFWLTTTAPLPEPAAKAARAQAGTRYDKFVAALGGRFIQGPKLRQEIPEKVDIESSELVARRIAIIPPATPETRPALGPSLFLQRLHESHKTDHVARNKAADRAARVNRIDDGSIRSKYKPCSLQEMPSRRKLHVVGASRADNCLDVGRVRQLE